VHICRIEAHPAALNLPPGGGGEAGTSEHQFGFSAVGVGAVAGDWASAEPPNTRSAITPVSTQRTAPAILSLAASALLTGEEPKGVHIATEVLFIEPPSCKRLLGPMWRIRASLFPQLTAQDFNIERDPITLMLIKPTHCCLDLKDYLQL